MSDTYDLVAIGGGTAGIVATRVAAAIGGKVAMIEAERPGGDCLWTGCVPSKSLIASASAAHTLRRADRFGLDPVEPAVDLGRILDRVRAIQAAVEPSDSAAHLESLGVEVIPGRARLVGPTTIAVVAVDGSTRTVQARKIVLATGSSPIVPPIGGLDDPLTSDDVWQLASLPESLLVIGGGAIGCELGQAFARLGSRVTIVEAASRLLPGFPEPAAAAVTAALSAEGVEIMTGRELTHLDEIPATERVLVAIGRMARTDDLGLDEVGVELTPAGTVAVDEVLSTSTPSIYAAGDVTIGNGSTTLSAEHGRHIGLHAMVGRGRPAAPELVPAVVFTDPQVAMVGRVEPALERVRYDHTDHDRSLTAGARGGFTELTVGRRGRLVGGVVVGPTAGESIAELALAVTLGASVGDLTGPHAYPTFADATARAAEGWLQDRWAGETWRGDLARRVVSARRWWDRRTERWS